MKRITASLVASMLAIAVVTSSALAADPVTITINGVHLLAKGVAVEVTFDIVCDGENTGVDYGYASVTQRVRNGAIAAGEAGDWTWGTWSQPLVCDGATRNAFAQVVSTDSGLAFKSGTALVEVYASIYGGAHRTTLELKLTK